MEISARDGQLGVGNVWGTSSQLILLEQHGERDYKKHAGNPPGWVIGADSVRATAFSRRPFGDAVQTRPVSFLSMLRSAKTFIAPTASRTRSVSGGTTRALHFALLFVALLAAACGHKVGDSCRVSSDCDPTGGSRICDVSQPGGYCLVEGCDEYSCPSDSACIRLFPAAFLSKPCDPTLSETGCAANELCLDIGLCAQRSLEHRECLQTCGDNGDCRGGYECRLAGTKGSMPFSRDPKSQIHFCAPAA